MKKDTSLSSCAGDLFIAFLTIFVSAFVGGLALSLVWNWYVPTLFGLTTLTIWQALGLSIVLKMFVGTSSSRQKSSDDVTTRMLSDTLEYIFTCAVFVGIAWVILQFAF